MAARRRQIIAAGRVITPRADLVPGVVEIDGPRIAAVRKGTARQADIAVAGGDPRPWLG